ncbi:glycine cleavage system H protein [Cohaesibacter sp. ES.047]|uniref:glycine cleavage system protein GcvH n=1 Tax=Cohaesibacter sp. ES.047 TaxID=1798205 RepID=UPI000BB8B077|nr:glycine cleavage system protein GcvH [Cohaesibacter sp. ES.047]SNY92045.1 glycine cleavage system H protein [Cohaesibacter sp. ES.047]
MSTYYSEEHEWISVEGDVATIGITNYAQSQLGDIVFVELPDVGTTLEKSDEAAVVESVKAASEVYAPLDGEVVETNGSLEEDPAMVNSDPEGDAWFIKLKLSNKKQLDDLMNEDEYKALVADLD